MRKSKKKQKSSKKKDFFEFFKNNKIFLLLFLISTSYFLYENIISVSWDLSVYVLNAQQIFSESLYLEVGRPPMASIIIGILGLIFGWAMGEILFVVFTSTLFAYAIYQLSKTLKFNSVALYAISLNIYVLVHGMAVGTEILSLSFLIIAINLIIKNNAVSGIFLGLTGLTRYTALALFPLSIFHFNTKKILTSIILFGLTVFAWLGYNYFVYGNMFESIANQYALNVVSRADLSQPISAFHLLQVTNILLPFFVLGLIVSIKQIIKNLNVKIKAKNKLKQLRKFLEEKKPELIIIAVLIYSVYSYVTTPVKIPRYLFFLVLPTIYFSYIGIKEVVRLLKKKESMIKKIALAIFLTTLIIMLMLPTYRDREAPYARSIEKLEEHNVSYCQIGSNVWPYLNYLGVAASPLPHEELVQESIEQGKILHVFKSARDPEYVQDEEFMKSLPIIYEENNLYIIGTDSCKESVPVINRYLQEIKDIIYARHDYEPNINPCFIMFNNYGFVERTCNLIHGKGFTKDENRELW